MNEDEFENKLRALTISLYRPDPTVAWKADILARARRDAEIRAPRWLLVSLGMAWVFAAILRFTTLDTAAGQSHAGIPDVRLEVESQLHEAPDTPLRALIALQSNPEFPNLP